MIADGASKVRLADADLEFAPLKGWFGGAKKEKIDGWECEVGGGRHASRVQGPETCTTAGQCKPMVGTPALRPCR